MSLARARQADDAAPDRRAALGFLFRLALGWTAALLLIAFVPALERAAIGATVACVRTLLHAASIPATATGAILDVRGRLVEISPDCTPLFPTLVLWAAILAFPAPARWKLAGALAGAAALWLYNLSRLMATIAVILARPAWFDFVHATLWQTVTLVVVIGLFVLWLRLAPRAPEAA